MVRAILDGRKTVTRRCLKQPFTVHPNGYITKPRGNENLCPYTPPYQPGDILYVRETWTNDKLIFGNGVGSIYRYKADGEEFLNANGEYVGVPWRPSIHMPKEAARIFIKVTDVRVERLQDITEEQAQEEGAMKCLEVVRPDEENPVIYQDSQGYYVIGFKNIWNNTVKQSDLDRYGWNANPYVWVIEFENCDKPEKWDKENAC